MNSRLTKYLIILCLLLLISACRKEENEVIEDEPVTFGGSIVSSNYKWDTVETFRHRIHDFEPYDGELWVGGEFYFESLGNKHGFSGQISSYHTFSPSYYITFNTPIFYPKSTHYGIKKILNLGDTMLLAGGENLAQNTYEGIFSLYTSNWHSQFKSSLPGDFHALCSIPGSDSVYATMHLSNYDGVIKFIPNEDPLDPAPVYSLTGLSLDGKIRDLIVYENELYACGDFVYSFNNTALNFIAKFANGEWTNIGSGLFGPARKMLVYDGELYVVGEFSSASGVPGTGGIAKWNGYNWSSVSGGLGGQGVVEDIVVSSDEQLIIVGGSFNYNGMNNLAYHTIHGGWQSFPKTVSGHVNAIDIYNDHIFIGMRHHMNTDSSSILVW